MSRLFSFIFGSVFERDISSAEAYFFFSNGKIWSSSFEYKNLILSGDRLINVSNNGETDLPKTLLEFYSKRKNLSNDEYFPSVIIDDLSNINLHDFCLKYRLRNAKLDITPPRNKKQFYAFILVIQLLLLKATP